MTTEETELSSLIKLTSSLMDDAYNSAADRKYMDKEFLQGIFDKLQMLPIKVAGQFSETGRWSDARSVLEVAHNASEHIGILLKLSTLMDSIDKLKEEREDGVQSISELIKMAQPPKKGATGGGVN